MMDTRNLLSLISLISLVLVIGPRCAQGYWSKTCDYNGKTYYPGLSEIMPCIMCYCSGDTGDFTCYFKECPPLNSTCTKTETPPGHCCPTCVEHGCFYNGVGYPSGSRIPLGPCSYCYCPWESNNDGSPVCAHTTCKEVTCPGQYVRPGTCCPVCPREENFSVLDTDPYGYDDLLPYDEERDTSSQFYF